MPDQTKKRKKYEPPVVKEIGGAFEQAMGVSRCQTGGGVGGAGDCANGFTNQSGDCLTGARNQSCLAGASDAGAACQAGAWGG